MNQDIEKILAQEKFIDACMNGNIDDFDRINDYLEYWSEHETNTAFPEFLGMTTLEYEKWMEFDTSTTLQHIIEERLHVQRIAQTGKPFLSALVDGDITDFEHLCVYTKYWHEHETGVEINHFLGFTNPEMLRIVKNGIDEIAVIVQEYQDMKNEISYEME